MSKRLVKIAKELNVGTTTIVEFLQSNGFEIDNKPTSKVSDDMYDILVKEFSNSIAVKEKADKLVIGNRSQEEPQEVKVEKPVEPQAESEAEPVKEERIDMVLRRNERCDRQFLGHRLYRAQRHSRCQRQ